VRTAAKELDTEAAALLVYLVEFLFYFGDEC
jgi:hypothetical protein